MYPGSGHDPDPGQPEYPPPQDPFLTGSQPPVPGSPPPPPPLPPTQYYPPVFAQPSPPGSPYPQPAQPSPSWWTSQGILLLVVAVVAIFSILAVVGVATWVIARQGKPSAPLASGPASVPPSTAAPLVADPATGLVLGSGPVWVDVYVDYQCPPCGLLEESTGPVLTDYLASDRVTLSIHPVAFIDDRSKNRYSTRSAAAMACAYEAGKGAEFHRYLLEHQPPEDTAGPADDDLIAAGRALGAGGSFDTCVSTGRKLDWVKQATTEANRDGVDSVPAVFVNDRDVRTTRAALVAAIDSAK